MGPFVSVEGGDGAGKSTLLNRIEAFLKENSVPFLRTREPGGTAAGEEIRAVLVSPNRSLNALTELFLIEAARVEHVHSVILPALKSGQAVICDRFTTSTLAYQGAGRGLGTELVQSMNTLATDGLEPQLTVWLRLDPKVALSRVRARSESNRLDQESESFHRTVYDAFSKYAAQNPATVITLDATLPPDELFDELTQDPRWKTLWETLQ
jgi:dTMP kinase